MEKYDIYKKIVVDKPKKGYGVIYFLYCKISKKGYIGQASNYVSGNLIWGKNGRWKSHVREATSGSKDHCVLLNQAIRKYGQNQFSILTVEEVEEDRLDEKEKFYIEVFGSISPNGYNLEKGGRVCKIISEESRKKHSESTKGKILSDELKKKLSVEQIGLVRDHYRRKYEEDVNLPKYISATRHMGKICGYNVTFPIGIDTKEYIVQCFSNSYDTDLALDNAKQYLNELKEKHKNRFEEINKKREERLVEYQQDKIEKKTKTKLSEYIFPIIRNNKINGYYVENMPSDKENETYPKKEFTELSCNRKNLFAAHRYIKSLEILNTNSKFKEEKNKDIPYADKAQYIKNKENQLPKYLAYVIVNGEKIGYQINNFPLSKTDIRKKKFCDKKIPMVDKYKLAIDFLADLWKKKRELETINNHSILNNLNN
ncbi:MAG: GIY-YIG catalytic domain-containing endonuclease [Terrestrivirus sp.]|uniref:GIY-YIG catalytic domain-containing endonuclease n=1 Tax=Terrestrivirus sp. TaxID=2487775 RepID=A0A3G4ZN39_9VIRU|nr:MAG: GIY-YIG catalytic domain-containing endonuclease [Terrestrivirus sp.]